MSGVQQRLKLKQTPIDTWSLKEHLTLASAVLKNGDQNWVSVSRTMKQLGEGGRPSDWFKDKNCALQYNLLLEKADIPTRKRGEKTDSSETPAQRIVNQLSQERMAELKLILEKERLEILKLEEQTQLLSSDDTTEEQLEEVMREVEAEEAEEDAKEQQAVAWLQSREEKKMAIQAALKSGIHRAKFGMKHPIQQPSQSQSEQSGSEQDSAVGSPQIDSVDSDSQQVDVESVASTQLPPSTLSGLNTPVTSKSPAESPTTGTSPLLTSLLQSPTRSSGSVTSPIKTAAISSLAQKLASPTLTFSSPSLTPALLSVAADTADLKKPDNDLTETLIDLEELLNKELGDATKEEPQKEKEEKVEKEEEKEVEQKIEEKVETPEVKTEEPQKQVEQILEAVKEKYEKDTEMDITEEKTSKRGRPRKTTVSEEFKIKASPIAEEEVKPAKKRDKEDSDKTKASKPTSPKPKQASPPPEVKTSPDHPVKNMVVAAEPPAKKAMAEVVKSEPSTPEPTQEEVEQLVWKKSVLGMLARIGQHKHAHLFASPVSEVVAPEYRDMVYRPMDLGSITSNIESGHIDSTEGMLRDIHLVFLNATMYNSSDTNVYMMTLEMQAETMKILEDFQAGKLESPLLLSRSRGRSVSGTGNESPVSSRSRTVSSSGAVEDRRKRERTSSVAEDGVAKKRRLRNIDEN